MDFNFTEDWFTPKIPAWEEILHKKWSADYSITALEIGVFEGRSSCWILENLFCNSKSTLYCIDTFEDSIEHTEEQTVKIKQVKILKGKSDDTIISLINKNIQADFICIDDSHIAKDALTDAVLSWKLLKNGSIMIFDDYLYRKYSDINMLPKIAIDSFVNIFFDEIIILKNTSNAQFYILKNKSEAQNADI